MDSKHCKSCGRRFEWRKKWANVWDDVVYCSAACRRRRVGPSGRRFEAVIMEILGGRSVGVSICPSEVARRECGARWRGEMEAVRRAARRLALAGKVEVTQRGRVVDPSDARGPVRYRLVQRRFDA